MNSSVHFCLIIMMLSSTANASTNVLPGNHIKAAIQHAIHITNKSVVDSRAISRAIFLGDDERLRHALHKAYSGQLVKISIIGGSISFGLGAGRLGDRALIYADRLRAWAKEAWPASNVMVVNGAFPAVTSSYMSSCSKLHTPIDSDIIIVELASNDAPSYLSWGDPNALRDRKGFERLVRSLLSRENHPAVVLLNTFQHPNNLPEAKRDRLYFENAEAYYFDLATYYGLTLLSLKAAAFPSILNSVNGFWINTSQYAVPEVDRKNYLFWDNQHLSSLNGHRLLADLVIALFHRISRKLAVVPWQGGAEDAAAAGESPLPPPIFPGNFEKKNEVCIVGENLLKAVVAKKGFEWINDQVDPAKPAKLGWTAYEPGAEISLVVNSGLNQSSSTLSIGYLVSYEKMGTFSVSCSSCECDRTVIDGHEQSRKVSQMSVAHIKISSHSNCTVHIQTLSQTKSGENKVKINALMLGDEPFRDVSLLFEQPWGVSKGKIY